MRKSLLSIALVLLVATQAFSQKEGDFNRYEIFIGYSHLVMSPVEIPILERTENGKSVTYKGSEIARVRQDGVNLSTTGNLSRYFGLKFDFSRYSETRKLPVETSPALVEDIPFNSSLYKYMGGIQMKDNSKEKAFKPFAHVLFGTAVSKKDVALRLYPDNQTTFFNTSIMKLSSSAYSAAAGGGLDIRINSRFDLRAVQLDYNQANINNQIRKNVRIGVGVVFR